MWSQPRFELEWLIQKNCVKRNKQTGYATWKARLLTKKPVLRLQVEYTSNQFLVTKIARLWPDFRTICSHIQAKMYKQKIRALPTSVQRNWGQPPSSNGAQTPAILVKVVFQIVIRSKIVKFKFPILFSLMIILLRNNVICIY